MNSKIGKASTPSLLRVCAGVGLTLGTAWGLVQSAAIGMANGAHVGLREWTATLGASAMAHATLWTAYGLLLGLLGALVAAVDRRVAQRMAAGPFAVAAFAAGAGTLLLWSGAASGGGRGARGLGIGSSLLAAGGWVVLFAAAYKLAGWAAARIGRPAQMALRRTALPLAVLVALWLVLRIGAGPDAVVSPGAWRQEWAGARKDRVADRPSVVLIVLGTARADRLGCYGYAQPTTPHLDDFAADALVFDQCLTSATATLPALASILTGLHPLEHEAGRANPRLDDRFSTLAELLGQRGYETVALHNGRGATDRANLLQGFSRIFLPRRFQRAKSNSIGAFVDRVLYPAGLVGRRTAALFAEDAGAGLTNRLVRRWLDGRNREQPFFLYVEYAEAEETYRPGGLAHGNAALAGELYDAALRNADDRLGELLSILSPRVALDDAIVVVTADHGQNLGDHSLMGHDRGVHDTLARVPLIVRYPRRARPARSDDVVQVVDILPTVQDAVSGDPAGSPSIFGRSLLPLPGSLARAPAPMVPALPGVRIVELTGRVAVTEGAPLDDQPEGGTLYAIRQGPWKYVRRSREPGGPADAQRPDEQLYRIVDDPGERLDLLDQHREIADVLAGTLDRWLASISDEAEK